MAENFFGKEPMRWWIGQVTDPKKGKWYNSTEAHRTETGEDIFTWRCRVRIVGYHDNADDLPDEDLPLAHVLLPAGTSTTGGQGMTMEYQGGEVVVGFWADGDDMQQPIVFGTLFKQEYLEDEVESGMFNSKNQVDFVPWTAPEIVQKMGPHQQNDASVANSPKPRRTMSNLNKSKTDQYVSTASDNKIQNRVPCEGNEVARIQNALKEFTDKVQAMKKIAEHDKHIDPVFGTTFNMEEETKLVTGKVHDATTAIIRRSRAFAVQDTLGKLKTELQDKTPKTLQGATGQASQDLIDVVFCNFEKVQDGMLDYLSESIGNMANQALDVPQCAIESMLGDMFGQVGNILDSQLGNMFGALGNITGGAIGGMGGMPSDLFDKGLVFADMAQQVLDCDSIKCPPPTTFSTRNGTFTGVPDDMKGIMEMAALRRLPTSEGTTAPNCESNILKCGPPKIDFMGGGGNGLDAKAVINATGQLIGASIFNSGFGFKRPPALNFVDSCDNGYGSSAYPTLGPVSSLNSPSVSVQSAGGVQIYGLDSNNQALIITAGGDGGINVTKINGDPIVTNQGPLKAGAQGGQRVTAGGMGGIQLNDESCGDLTVSGEGGSPLMVGDKPLTIGEFTITCGGISPIKDNLITLPTGEKVDTYWEPGPSGEIASDHWDKDGNYGTGPSSKSQNDTNISLTKGIPVSECINIQNGGQDYGEVFEPGTMGKVVQITPIISAGVNYGGSLEKLNLPTVGGTGSGLTVDVQLVPLPSSIRRKSNGNVAVSAGVEFIEDPATGEITYVPIDTPPYPVETGLQLVEEFGVTELPPTTGSVLSVRINKQGSGYKAQDVITIPNLTILDAVVDKNEGNVPATFKVFSIKPPTGGAVDVPVSGGSGTGLTINYDAIDGVIDTVLVNKPGTGYAIGDILNVPGGDGTGQISLQCLKTQMNSEGTAGGSAGIGDIQQKVDNGGVYVPDPAGLEMGITDVVIVDPGSSFLPNTVQTELDIDPTSPTYGQQVTTDVSPDPDASYDGESSYVTSLKDVKVKNAGYGYSDNDTATVVSTGGGGAASGSANGPKTPKNGYWLPGPDGLLGNDHWDKNGNYGDKPIGAGGEGAAAATYGATLTNRSGKNGYWLPGPDGILSAEHWDKYGNYGIGGPKTGQDDIWVSAGDDDVWVPTGDTEGGSGGANVELDIVDGFIVNARVTGAGSGFTSLPEIRINSDTGIGGRLLPVLKFTKIPDARKRIEEGTLPANTEIITVIDCVQQ